MKKEKLGKFIDAENKLTDIQIKNLFHENVQTIKLTEASKNKLHRIPLSTEKQSFIQRFLEKEILISLPSFALGTSAIILLVGIYVTNLVLITDMPKPKYEIINLQYNSYISQERGR